jgi:hypothetical protein
MNNDQIITEINLYVTWIKIQTYFQKSFSFKTSGRTANGILKKTESFDELKTPEKLN